MYHYVHWLFDGLPGQLVVHVLKSFNNPKFVHGYDTVDDMSVTSLRAIIMVDGHERRCARERERISKLTIIFDRLGVFLHGEQYHAV